MHETVEQGRDHHHVAEPLCPILERAVRGDDRRALLVVAHEHVGEFIASLRACKGGDGAQIRRCGMLRGSRFSGKHRGFAKIHAVDCAQGGR